MKFGCLIILLLLGIETFAQKSHQTKDDYFDETVDELLPNIVLNTYYNFVQNPAMAGLEKRQNLQIRYNDLCQSCNNNLTTITNTTNQYYYFSSLLAYDISLFKKRKFSIGTYFNYQQGGIMKRSLYNLSLSYKQVIKHTHLRFGIYTNSLFYKGDMANAQTNSPLDPVWHEEVQNPVFELGTGIMIQHYNFYSGVTIKNLNNPNVYFLEDLNTTLYKSLNYFGTYKFKLKKALTLYPILDYSYNWQNYSIFNPGLTITIFDEIMMGMNYTLNDWEPEFYKINFGIDLYQSIILSGSVSVGATKEIRSFSTIDQFQTGIFIQFGSTKKNMVRWSDM